MIVQVWHVTSGSSDFRVYADFIDDYCIAVALPFVTKAQAELC